MLKGTGRVAQATREKVLSIAKELDYVPNATAHARATGRTGAVAVLSGPLNEPFYANIVHLLETHLTASGYEITLLHTRREARSLMQATQASLVDGVIAIVSDHFPDDFLRQRIAYAVNNRDESVHVEVRMRTYLKTMDDAGRTPELIDVNTRTRSEERVQAIKTYLEANGCPDALLCQNDETAMYAYRALVGLGYRLPEQVMLVGCDGLPYMEFFDPSLSTIALPIEEICTLAAGFLQQRIATPDLPVQQATLQGQLVVRKSLRAL